MNTLVILSNEYFCQEESCYKECDFIEALSDKSKWTIIETEGSILPALCFIFQQFPLSAKLYKETISNSTEIEITNSQTISELMDMQGTFYCVVYPLGGVGKFVKKVFKSIVKAIVRIFRPSVSKPKIPSVVLKNTQISSPNNELADRTNNPRPLGRIADIFGTVRSTPDLICVPRSVFYGSVEHEEVVACIGRGMYQIHDAKDGDTPISQLSGSGIGVYYPHTNIVSGTPYYRIGSNPTGTLVAPVKCNPVNGQTLWAPNHKEGREPLGTVGWFDIDLDTITQVQFNLVCMSGIYKDNGEVQTAWTVSGYVYVQRVNDSGAVIGSTSRSWSMTGSAKNADTVAISVTVAVPNGPGHVRVAASRTSEEDQIFQGSVVDTVQWKDCYGLSPITNGNFGNCTMVRMRIRNTTGALAVKDRKLNMLVTRQIPVRLSGTTFSSDLRPTNNAADIFCAICLDPLIGGRTISELDIDNIYNTMATVQSYFGTSKAIEFCYTFDNDGLTFEQTAALVAEAAFCRAYRKGNVIRLSFEKQTNQSLMLFNHRNKIPGTENRTFTFSTESDYDGVEYDYVSPKDDSMVTLYLPANRSAIKAQKVESVGVRNDAQANLHAKRIYNKMKNSYENVSITTTLEGSLATIGDRILIADNVRPKTIDGEVVAQDGLILQLSQPVDLLSAESYVIFLQLPDGTVESMSCTQGTSPYLVVIPRAPRMPLVLDNDSYVHTLYTIVTAQNTEMGAYLVASTSPNEDATVSIQAVNYSDAYYANDKDYVGA